MGLVFTWMVALTLSLLPMRPALAVCFFGCEEATQKTAFTALKPKDGVEQRKLVTYAAKEFKKVVSKNTTDNAVFNFLSGQEYTAQIISTVYLGADLSDLKPEDVLVSDCDIVGKCVVTVNPPPILVISTELDLQNSVIVAREEGLFVSNEDTAAFIQKMFEQHKNQIAAEAINDEKNIAEARRNLKSTLRDIIVKKVGDGTNVRFTS